MSARQSRTLTLFTAALGVGLGSWASAQEAERLPAAPESPQAVDSPEASAVEQSYPTVAGGEVHFVPVTSLSDEIPLPETRASRAEASGDEQLAPRSGDPFFLGFSGGIQRPAAGLRVDPRLAALAQVDSVDGRGSDSVYAFVMFEKRITDARRAELESYGVRILGFHPYHSLKVSIPRSSIGTVSGLPFVHWVGLAQSQQKLHPILSGMLADAAADETLEVFVNLFDSDLTADATARLLPLPELAAAGTSQAAPATTPREAHSYSRTGGWQEASLLERGMQIDYYHDGVRSFRGRMTRSAIEALVGEDWVLFVEPWQPPSQAHDESTPLISSDWARNNWDGGTNHQAVVGIADGGVQNSHFDLNHIYGIGWDQASSGTGPWHDGGGHGTHVSGTILGNGDVIAGHTGNAPGLATLDTRRYFNVKIFNDAGNWGGSNMTDILDVLNEDYVGTTTTPKPHVINHSWRTLGGAPYYGTENDARLLDNDIYIFDQLHIFAAGNEGSGTGTIGLQSSAKNVLTVGSVQDYYYYSFPILRAPGLVASSSSRGPCADGRWKPNVCAPGTSVTSTDNDSSTGYVNYSGTSMATPHVVGVAAQLVDKYSFLRYNPPSLSALMMASAITYQNEVLTTPDNSAGSHLNTYGAGKINALKANGGNSQQALYFWRMDITSSNYGYVDLPIQAGATQVTFVMTYTEIAGSAGASTALVNDMDMYIDRAPFTAGGNTGEYFAQQSSRDNTEVRIVTNPTATDYRIKIYPENFVGGFFSTVKVGICAVVTYGDTTPIPTFVGSVDDSYVKPNETVTVSGAATNPTYFAEAAYITTSSTGGTLSAVHTTLADGVQTDLLDNYSSGNVITLGDVHHNQTRTGRWDVSWGSEGVKTFTMNLSGNNFSTISRPVNVTVDGTAPAGPSGLNSTTHTPGSPSCSTGITAHWTAATDALSGLNGYNVAWNTNPTHVGAQTITTSAGSTSASTTLAPGSTYYFHIRPVDRSNNWGTTQHLGPFQIVSGGISSYCTASPNSTGFGASMGSFGSTSISSNNFVLATSGLPANQPSLYFYGQGQTNVPFGNGRLCINGLVVRLPVIYTGNGSIQFPINFNNLPALGQIHSGSTWNFQNWYRDPQGGGSAFNLTDGLRATFCN